MMPKIKRLTLAVLIAASCNLVWQFYRMHQLAVQRQRLYDETGWVACTLGPSQDFVSRFHLELFLILAFAGSCAKGLKNTLLSVVGLTGAVISYLFWWQYIFRIARNAEASVNAIPHFAYLAGGNFLDVGIAVMIGLLVLLNVRSAVLSSFRLTV